MPEYRFESVRLVLGDSNKHLRQNLKSAMLAEGFREFVECATVSQMERIVGADAADLLLCDADLDGGDVNRLIHDIRHHRVGKNPFILIMVMLGDTTMERVRSIVDCGADDLLVKPISRKQVMDRVENLINARRPFVVTHDYIGPDRRKNPRDDDKNPIPQMHVPNVLRVKALGGNVNPHNLQRVIDATAAKINERKMERYAFQIGWLVDRIREFHAGKRSEGVIEELDRLVYVSEDLSRRLRGTSYAYVADLAMSMVGLSTRLRDLGDEAEDVDLELLPKLSQAIWRAFDPDKTTAAVAQEISRSIKQHTETGDT